MTKQSNKRTHEQTNEDMGDAKSKVFVPYTEDQLWEMSRDEISETLNEKQRRWCEVYVKSFNSELAAIKAGYSKASAYTVSRRLRKQSNVLSYLAWLKLRAVETLDVRPIDILEQYAKIGFADITDYVTLNKGRLTLVDSDLIDGQVVKSYRVGPQGTTIELHDKMAALHHLEQFFSEMPKSWQQRLEERKMEILEAKLVMEREALGNTTDNQTETGSALIAALRGVAVDIWKDEGDDPDGDN